MYRRIGVAGEIDYHFGVLMPTAFEEIVSTFGPLDQFARKRLLLLIVQVLVAYHWGRLAQDRLSESRLSTRYRTIRDAVNRLNDLLGASKFSRFGSAGPSDELTIDHGLGVHLCEVLIEQSAENDELWQILTAQRLPLGGVVTGGHVRGSPFGLTHHAALRLATIMLAPLSEAANRAYKEARAATKPGQGGDRRSGETLSTACVDDLIHVYLKMRRRYPGPGPRRSRSGPLRRFVLTVLKAAAEHAPELRSVTDAAIGVRFRKIRPFTCGVQIVQT